MIPLEKKTNTNKCGEHRTISLISHALKTPLKALCNRLTAKVKAYIGRDQFGFMAGRGTRDAIALLRVISEKAIDHCKDVFVDYEKAFDRVHWSKFMEVLVKIGADYRDREMIWNLYMNQTA